MPAYLDNIVAVVFLGGILVVMALQIMGLALCKMVARGERDLERRAR